MGNQEKAQQSETQQERFALRQFTAADVALLKTWLGREHVASWYEHPQDWIREAEDREGEYSWIHHFVAELGGIPVGFCQYYEYCRGGEAWHGSLDTRGAYSMDYLIGEPAYLGRGLGRELIKALTERISSLSDARLIIVQPEAENRASCAALMSAGFEFDEENKLYKLTL